MVERVLTHINALCNNRFDWLCEGHQLSLLFVKWNWLSWSAWFFLCWPRNLRLWDSNWFKGGTWRFHYRKTGCKYARESQIEREHFLLGDSLWGFVCCAPGLIWALLPIGVNSQLTSLTKDVIRLKLNGKLLFNVVLYVHEFVHFLLFRWTCCWFRARRHDTCWVLLNLGKACWWL